MEHGLFSTRVFRLTMLCWLIFKAVSGKLWFSFGRTFPVVPAFSFLENISFVVQDGISLFSLAGILILLFSPGKRGVQSFVIVAELILQGFDLLRGQPMFFQFWLTLVIYRFANVSFRYYFTLLMAATYFFSGLHKLNSEFVIGIWKDMILTRFLDLGHFSGLVRLGWAIPVIECLLGVGLFTRWHRWALFGLIVFPNNGTE